MGSAFLKKRKIHQVIIVPLRVIFLKKFVKYLLNFETSCRQSTKPYKKKFGVFIWINGLSPVHANYFGAIAYLVEFGNEFVGIKEI